MKTFYAKFNNLLGENFLCRLGRTNLTKKSIFSVGKSEPLYSLTLARNYFALKTQKRYNI